MLERERRRSVVDAGRCGDSSAEGQLMQMDLPAALLLHLSCPDTEEAGWLSSAREQDNWVGLVSVMANACLCVLRMYP